MTAMRVCYVLLVPPACEHSPKPAHKPDESPRLFSRLLWVGVFHPLLLAPQIGAPGKRQPTPELRVSPFVQPASQVGERDGWTVCVRAHHHMRFVLEGRAEGLGLRLNGDHAREPTRALVQPGQQVLLTRLIRHESPSPSHLRRGRVSRYNSVPYMPRATLYTIGCRLNHAETALLGDQLRRRGYAL